MSIAIQLPDGSVREYDRPVTALDVAEEISPRLAKAAVAAEVDGELRDLRRPLDAGRHDLKLLTDRDRGSLEVLRHTAAHVLAQAVVRLYGPQVQYTIGPALMDDFQYGFYYDFDLPRPVGVDDLGEIEREMEKIISQKLPTERSELSADEAKAMLAGMGQGYKVELIEDLQRGDGVERVSLYRQGEFVDLCRGPHLPDTGRVKAFKLLTTAGAYWRGSEQNKMLTRIYGTAFFDAKDLAAQLERIEQARKRDHRVLGRQLGLFVISDAVGQGLPLWLPNGAIVRSELESWLRAKLVEAGYQMVYTPHIGKLGLYRTSGHYPYYRQSQFPPISSEEEGEEGFLLKPMNCPHHVQIYKCAQQSYRDLPVRLAEFGSVYRWEQSGELTGLTRVRGFTQDDAHIFCTPEQLEGEIEACIDLVKLVLATLELQDYRVRIGLRDPQSDKYVGQAAHWAAAEETIRQVVRRVGMDYTEQQGEAAFYGPKIDFIVKDCIGRDWQLGTIQVDYNLPERFELEYIGADNTPHRPVMIHRAPFGSLERFIGILIEHFAGAFPLWLSPRQVAVLPVSEKFADYAGGVADDLRRAGLRVDLDASADKIGAKIRRATIAKVPYMLVVGGREQESRTVSVRHRTEGDMGAQDVQRFVELLREEVAARRMTRAKASPAAGA